jgi:hypothetical protein
LDIAVADFAVPARLANPTWVIESNVLGKVTLWALLVWESKLFKAPAIVCLHITQAHKRATTLAFSGWASAFYQVVVAHGALALPAPK